MISELLITVHISRILPNLGLIKSAANPCMCLEFLLPPIILFTAELLYPELILIDAPSKSRTCSRVAASNFRFPIITSLGVLSTDRTSVRVSSARLKFWESCIIVSQRWLLAVAVGRYTFGLCRSSSSRLDCADSNHRLVDHGVFATSLIAGKYLSRTP